jgi:uncharacterized protein (PEP-CTERM system associated)
MSQRLRAMPIHSSLRQACKLCCGMIFVSVSSVGHAQEVRDEEATAVVRTGVWVEPRVSVGLTLTNNGSLDGSNTRNEQILEAGPGVRAVVNKPRVRGFLDYSLSGLYHAQSTAGDRFRNTLDALATVEAVDNRVFIDLAGTVGDEAVSAFGTQSGVPRTGINRSETASFRASPYVRGSFAGVADYELRYALESVSTDSQTRSDVTVQEIQLRLGNRSAGARLGWSLDASSQEADYSLGRKTQADIVRGALIYTVTPQVRVALLAGVESNNVITLNRVSYNTYGANMEWRPSDRSRVFVEAERRYFGTGHTISLDHRTGRTVWRYSNTRGAVTNTLAATSASLGSIYDLLDGQFLADFPDPVARAQRVDAELRRLGLPADAEVFDDFLRSSAALERSQRLSVALVGVRSVVTFAVARGDSQRLDPVVALGDDFDLNTSIRQRSWSINYAHRLTPITSFTAALSNRRNIGTALGQENRLRTLTLGATTQLGVRTSGSVQLLRSYYDSSVGTYDETAISGLITHRF